MDILWDNISTALELSPELSEKWLVKLRKKYTESHRHYHNERELLNRKVPYLVRASVCLQLATLFQYYHFAADKDCMTMNCEAVTEFFADIGAGNKTLEANVKRLLGDLQSDAGDLSESDAHFFQDLDLLVLGSSPEEYRQYTQQLRCECSSDSKQSYNEIRLKLLQTLYRIPSIYLTKEFCEQLESIARKNIEEEIKELQASKF